VGVLAVRTGTRWSSPLPGDQRDTAALPQVLAAAVGLDAAAAEAAAQDARLRPLVDRIRRVVLATVPDAEVVGDPTTGCRTWFAFSSPYADGETLLRGLTARASPSAAARAARVGAGAEPRLTPWGCCRTARGVSRTATRRGESSAS
jgi:cysteine sulfinate desulfinase/cysteine desulfurase-like protein